MIEPLDWFIDCGENERDIAVFILSVLHTLPDGERQRTARDIYFVVLPPPNGMPKAATYNSHGRPQTVVLTTAVREKPIEMICHEISHYVLKHCLMDGPREVNPEAEEEARLLQRKCVARYDVAIERLKVEANVTTLRELFAKVYPKDFA